MYNVVIISFSEGPLAVSRTFQTTDLSFKRRCYLI